MGSVWFLAWIWRLGIMVACLLIFCMMCHIWCIFTLIMLLLTAVLIVFATWIWCSGGVLLVLVVVLLGIIVVLFAIASSHGAALIIRPIFAIIWALNMVRLNPAKLMLQEIIITKLLNSLKILQSILFPVYLILIPYDLAYRERLTTSILGSIILILLSLFVLLSVSVANIKDFLHRFRYGKII